MFDNNSYNLDMNNFDEMFNRVFTKNLVDILESKDMTQKRLADEIGVSPITISRYINGSRIPKLSVVYSICQVLDISMDTLCSLQGLEKDLYAHKEIDIDECLDNYLFKELWNGRVTLDGERMTEKEYTLLEGLITMGINQIRINRGNWSKSQIYPVRYN